ncbi:DUF6542 domain-containing protein [Streptomyces sp. NPDC052040]|uniref:DUF6542 domain-containing protein n=1 Tax=Streptomyces sp. NPDC052040 TaxID=3365682 RepID=UPI0037D1E7B9
MSPPHAAARDEAGRSNGQGGHRAAPSRGRSLILAVAAALVAAPVLGASVDVLSGSGANWGLMAGAVAGAVWAALLSARRDLLRWVAPLPTPAVAVAAVTLGMLANPSGEVHAAQWVQWALAAFPAMVAAECAVLVVAVMRAVRSRSRRRRFHA